MKRSYAFVAPRGVVACEVGGRAVELPIFAGVFKHPTEDELRKLLVDPDNARRYTIEALRKLPWSALRRFPLDWLRQCLVAANLPESRRRAVEFMLAP
jgi:hypothetical protein